MPRTGTNSPVIPIPEGPLVVRASADARALGEPVDVPDLRRRDARLHAEQIAGRARFLPRHESALILAIYEQGQSVADLAAFLNQPVRTLRREIKRILRRLTSDEFAFVAMNLESWPSTMRRVAQSCILAGVPVRTAAGSLRVSLHTVRKYRDMARVLASGAAGGPGGQGAFTRGRA